MDSFIGIGFVVLSVAVLIGICGIVGYGNHIHKKDVDISPAQTKVNKPKQLSE